MKTPSWFRDSLARAFFALALVLALFLCDLCAHAAEPAQPRVEFTTDGCTGYKDGPRSDRHAWRHCCVEHDLRFWAGGSEAARDAADLALKSCVASTGHPTEAEIMYLGVRLGKHSPWKIRRGFWGNAWHERPSGYAKLTPEQSRAVLESVTRRDRSGEVTSDMIARLEALLAEDLAR